MGLKDNISCTWSKAVGSCVWVKTLFKPVTDLKNNNNLKKKSGNFCTCCEKETGIKDKRGLN